MQYLSAWVTVALVAGLGGGVAREGPLVLAVTLAGSAGCAAALFAARRRHPRLLAAAVAILIAAAGTLWGARAVAAAVDTPLRRVLEERFGGYSRTSFERRAEDPILLEGRLAADAALTETSALLRLQVERLRLNDAWIEAAGGVSLGVSGELQAARAGTWRAGRVVRLPAVVRRPARYLNRGLPDQERALARRGVSLVGSVKSAALVEVVREGRWWEERAAALRAHTRAALARHVGARHPESADVAAAILIGDRAGLSATTERRLQLAGTYHVIAISGGNIAILAGALLLTLALVGVRGRVAALSVIVALAAYAIVAAGGASVLRATVMAAIYLAVRMIDQRTAPLIALSLTVSVILVVAPLQIVDVGFWFTCGATLALIAAATLVAPTATRARRSGWVTTAGRALLAVVIGTLSVECVLGPITAFVFQRVTVAGLVLNFVALPAMTAVQLMAIGVVIADAGGMPTLASWLGVGVDLASVALLDSARLLDWAPWLTWRVPPPWPALLAVYYAAAAAAGVVWRLRPSAAPAGAVPALMLLAWILVAPDARRAPGGDGRLHVSFLDVGQGDSALVAFPNGRQLLVDTGGVARSAFDIGERVIGPALRARRLLRLDYLAVTHADADHIGGAATLLRDFAPHEIWWSIPVANHPATADVRAEAAAQRSAWRTLQRGDHIEIGGVEVRTHHPPPPEWERQDVRNDDSLVLELRHGDVSILLTGDISREVEQALAPTLDLRSAVVLKVAHHGSATSSSPRFLVAVRPLAALIGVGRGNAYGHPASYVLGRLQDTGTEIFRTDHDGQIDLATDGAEVRITTWSGRRVNLGRPSRLARAVPSP